MDTLACVVIIADKASTYSERREAALAMQGWIDKGGFLPVEWNGVVPRWLQAALRGILNPQTIRWNEYENGGWVRLSLRRGESLHTFGGGRTEEGYRGWECSWTFDDRGLTRDTYTHGQDCDGRYASQSEEVCSLDELQGDAAWDETSIPVWQRVDELHRDYAAEAAGY